MKDLLTMILVSAICLLLTLSAAHASAIRLRSTNVIDEQVSIKCYIFIISVLYIFNLYPKNSTGINLNISSYNAHAVIFLVHLLIETK